MFWPVQLNAWEAQVRHAVLAMCSDGWKACGTGCPVRMSQHWFVMLQTVHQARIEQANGSGRAVSEERVLPDHKASLKEKDAELQVPSHHCMFWSIQNIHLHGGILCLHHWTCTDVQTHLLTPSGHARTYKMCKGDTVLEALITCLLRN